MVVRVLVGGSVGGHTDPCSLSVFIGRMERRGDAVLQTTQCSGAGSVLVHPAQWPKLRSHSFCTDMLIVAHHGILDRAL